MPIDPSNEELLTLTAASKILPSLDGKRIHPSTLWRWCHKGSRGIYLEFIRLGTRILTSVEALNRFMLARTAVESSPTHRKRRRTPASRQRAVDAAYTELEQRGAMTST